MTQYGTGDIWPLPFHAITPVAVVPQVIVNVSIANVTRCINVKRD